MKYNTNEITKIKDAFTFFMSSRFVPHMAGLAQGTAGIKGT